MAKSLELKDVSGIANAAAALDALAVRGKISAFDISKAFQDGLKGVDLGTFATNAAAAFDGSEQGARRLKSTLDAVALESLARAGTSVAELQGGFSKLGVSAINDVDALAKTLTDLGIKGDQAGKLLSTGLDKVLTLATTEKAVKAVEERILELGKKGLLTGDQIAAGLLKAREKADALKEGINSVDEALSKFGIKSRGELAKTATELQQSYAKIVNATTVSLAEKTAAFEQYSKAAIAANSGVESSEIRLQREILRNKQAAEDAGKRIEGAMIKAGGAVDQLSDKAREAAAELRKLSDEKYTSPKGGSVTGSSRAERLAGQAATDGTGSFALEAKRQAGTLSADDLNVARAVKSAADFNKRIFEETPQSFSNQGTASVNEDLNRANTILRQVEELAAKVGAPASATAASPAAAPDSAGVRNRTVTINMGGRSTTIGVNSAEDQNALTGVLRQLESGKGASQ